MTSDPSEFKAIDGYRQQSLHDLQPDNDSEAWVHQQFFITEHKLAEKALQLQAEVERLNRLKHEFLNTLSHELRTPLTSISLAVQTLEIVLKQEGLLNSCKFPTVEKLFDILRSECQRHSKLIDDLLTLTYLEARTEPLTSVAINLSAWIPTIVESFRERTRSQCQQLNIVIANNLPPLETDISDLERILNELLLNACKYTPPMETITVQAHATMNMTQLSVSNSGVEIATDELERIFDTFYRIPNHDPWRYGGTGLGLALVRKLVRRLGGLIHVESAASQTTFIVQFPQAV